MKKKSTKAAKPEVAKVKKVKTPRVPKALPAENITTRSGKVVDFGTLVRYYDEGWRYGYIESANGAVGSIRPIISKYAAIQEPRLIRIPLTDIDVPVS